MSNVVHPGRLPDQEVIAQHIDEAIFDTIVKRSPRDPDGVMTPDKFDWGQSPQGHGWSPLEWMRVSRRMVSKVRGYGYTWLALTARHSEDNYKNSLSEISDFITAKVIQQATTAAKQI